MCVFGLLLGVGRGSKEGERYGILQILAPLVSKSSFCDAFKGLARHPLVMRYSLGYRPDHVQSRLVLLGIQGVLQYLCRSEFRQSSRAKAGFFLLYGRRNFVRLYDLRGLGGSPTIFSGTGFSMATCGHLQFQNSIKQVGFYGPLASCSRSSEIVPAAVGYIQRRPALLHIGARWMSD